MTYKWSCALQVQDCVHHISLRGRLPARLTRQTGLYDFDRSAGVNPSRYCPVARREGKAYLEGTRE